MVVLQRQPLACSRTNRQISCITAEEIIGIKAARPGGRPNRIQGKVNIDVPAAEHLRGRMPTTGWTGASTGPLATWAVQPGWRFRVGLLATVWSARVRFDVANPSHLPGKNARFCSPQSPERGLLAFSMLAARAKPTVHGSPTALAVDHRHDPP